MAKQCCYPQFDVHKWEEHTNWNVKHIDIHTP